MKNHIFFKKGILIMLAFLTIMGCAAVSNPLVKSNQNSRQGYVNSHPELSEEIKRAILQAKIIEGMTKNEVEASWGKPDRISNYSTDPRWFEKDEEDWEYDRLLAIPIHVNFKDGIVESVNDSLK